MQVLRRIMRRFWNSTVRRSLKIGIGHIDVVTHGH